MNTDWSNKCGVRSLVVVPKTHTAPLKEPENARDVNWDVCRGDEGLAARAVFVDPRPTHRRDCLATLVLWNSRTVHCNGHFGRSKKRGRSTSAYSPTVTQDGHFLAADADAWLAFLEEHGYAVVELSMKAPSHERLLRLYREAVQLVNRNVVDASSPTCPRLGTIAAEHLPPYKTKGLQQFYGFASTPFADEARLEPEVRAVFAKIHGVEKGAMYCSLDASAIALAKGKNDNWLHRDQTRNPYFRKNEASLSVQGCLYLRPPKGYLRLAQMVAWHPVKSLTADEHRIMADFVGRARLRGACLTHNNHRVNKEGDKLVGNLAFFKAKLEAAFRLYTRGYTDPALLGGKLPELLASMSWRKHCYRQ
jgi:hypothetical protein